MARNEREEVARLVEDFVAGRSEVYSWDDFVSVASTDPIIEMVRERCLNLQDDYPAATPNVYCSEDGFQELLRLAQMLRDSR